MARIRQVTFATIFVIGSLGLAACGARTEVDTSESSDVEQDIRVTRVTVEEARMAQDKSGDEAGGAVAGLPHADGRSFATLDEYLSHLKRLSTQDVPWYREVEPGVYVYEAGRQPPGMEASERRWTRAELEARYGFATGKGSPADDAAN